MATPMHRTRDIADESAIAPTGSNQSAGTLDELYHHLIVSMLSEMNHKQRLRAFAGLNCITKQLLVTLLIEECRKKVR